MAAPEWDESAADRWSDIHIRADEIDVQRQYSASTRCFELPKNGKTRIVVFTAPAKGEPLGVTARSKTGPRIRSRT
jgi:hypothetical protein